MSVYEFNISGKIFRFLPVRCIRFGKKDLVGNTNIENCKRAQNAFTYVIFFTLQRTIDLEFINTIQFVVRNFQSQICVVRFWDFKHENAQTCIHPHIPLHLYGCVCAQHTIQ